MLERLKRIAPFLKPLLILGVFAIALRVLATTLAQYRYRDIVRYISSLNGDQIILAVVLTLLGYLVMTGYDTLAFEYIRHPLPYRKIALASFIGYAFNNNVGLSGLVGGSLRYRLYTAWRLSAVEIAKVIAFCTISFWLGFIVLGGTFFIVLPPEIPASVHLPLNSIRLLGIVLLLPALAYLGWIAFRREPVRSHRLQRGVREIARPDTTYLLTDMMRDVLEPHLCRCGTHMRILRAVQRAAKAVLTPTTTEAAP